MAFKLSKFTLRIDFELLKKFHYIARYNAHSSNHEIELLVRRHVNNFEDKHDKITLK